MVELYSLLTSRQPASLANGHGSTGSNSHCLTPPIKLASHCDTITPNKKSYFVPIQWTRKIVKSVLLLGRQIQALISCCLYNKKAKTVSLRLRMPRPCRDPTVPPDSPTSCRKMPSWCSALCANFPWSLWPKDLRTQSECLVLMQTSGVKLSELLTAKISAHFFFHGYTFFKVSHNILMWTIVTC